MRRAHTPGDAFAPSGPLASSGVTVDRMRAFADAAARFYEAAPWRPTGSPSLPCSSHSTRLRPASGPRPPCATRRRFSGPLEATPSTASTPLERAQEVVHRAFEARGRRRVQLARKALGDCADAYVILAEHAGNLERALDLYAQGAAAGERALGPRVFEEDAGHFWGLITTRPYMRARFGLAETLEALGRADEAVAHYRELLRLNPNDNQGVRERLLPALLIQGRDAEAAALLRQFRGESSAMWRYGTAFLAFRRDGEGAAARASLRRALRANHHALDYVTGERALPDTDPPAYELGSEEEAVLCARALAGAWRGSPGAVEWARTAARPEKRAKRRGQ